MIRPEILIRKSLAEVATYLGLDDELSMSSNIFCTGIACDSREIITGDLFVALPGTKVHGATFINEIKTAGAVAVLTDPAGAKLIAGILPTLVSENPRKIAGECASWFYDVPSRKISVVGITGTNGKTTTSSLLQQIWRFANRQTGLIGTVGIEIGTESIPASFTTPEGSDLQSLLAVMSERHIQNVAMEVSSHSIEMNRIDGTFFQLVGFTNLTQDHLDFHGDMATYFAAKRKLFSQNFTDLGLINIDDIYGAKIFSDSELPLISLSRGNPSAEWHYESAEMSPNGYSIIIRGTGGIQISGELNLIGEHNLDNLLMATAMAFQTGVDPMVIGNSFRFLTGAPGRLEKINLGQNFTALVDYAHTPDAVIRTLATLRKSCTGKIIAVLGCGGDRDRTKRPLMGEALLNGSDIAIFTSDNPRFEDAEEILKQMVEGIDVSDLVQVVINRREAIALAVASAQPGDFVVVLGKGHEAGQEISGVTYPFDDRLELARAIEELA
jgi:UDP-N-acetylmuramoyl-L-alanyl-D-glutamate--2,6-diaminopimelate ligase